MVQLGEGEGLGVRREIRHVVPVELRLTGIAEPLHQFSFDGQQVIETHEDIGASCNLRLDGLVIPMFDHRPLPHAGITFLLRFHLGAEGLVELVELMPKRLVVTLDGFRFD